ncbi:MAG: hypothetical protein ACI4GD_05580 [Lachnospiraceae bacterium]
MKKDYCMTVRVLTVAPVMATAFLICMLIHRFEVFTNIWQWLYYLLLMGILPLLAYPVQKYIPHFRTDGRHGQRILAMIFAVTGYILCCVINFIFTASAGAWVIILEYLLSGVATLVFNKAFHVKISGHACGVLGPVMLLFYFGLYIQALCGVLITALVYIASLKTKRHTLPQLIGGSIVPIAVIAALKLILG